MIHQECCFAIQKQHSFIFTRGLRKSLELPLKITNRKLKRILEEDCKKFINRQSSRKAVTQSYRACKMAASCTLKSIVKCALGAFTILFLHLDLHELHARTVPAALQFSMNLELPMKQPERMQHGDRQHRRKLLQIG